MAAGVRSIICTPCGRSSSSCRRCALAEVASKTMSICGKTSMPSSPSTPSAVVGMPSRFARAKPSDAGSTPTMAPSSMCFAWRSILTMRSVPMLPGPTMAAFSFSLTSSLLSAHLEAGLTQALHLHRDGLPGPDPLGRGRGPRHHHVARLQFLAGLRNQARRRHQRAQRVAEDGGGRSDLDHAAVDTEREPEVAEVLGRVAPRADHEAAGGCVVRD